MIFGSTPVIIVGAILYQTNLISYLRNIEIIAWTTLIFAILLYFADKFKVNKKLNAKLDLKTIIVILYNTLLGFEIIFMKSINDELLKILK